MPLRQEQGQLVLRPLVYLSVCLSCRAATFRVSRLHWEDFKRPLLFYLIVSRILLLMKYLFLNLFGTQTMDQVECIIHGIFREESAKLK